MIIEMTAPQMVNIIRNTLNHVDPRLVDHGMRVAGMLHAALRTRGGYDDSQIRDIGIASLLHDVGAYKTEDVDRLVAFETKAVWAHSIYGFLYLKHFSPIANLAPAIFFHHADFNLFSGMRGSSFELGQMLHLADRIDILTQFGKIGEQELRLRFVGNPRFNPETVELFADSGVFRAAAAGELDGDMFESAPLERWETRAYLRMLYSSIDFRSPQTVTHTAAVVEGARALAELLELPPESVDRVEAGAMLHDLGKQGTPTSILESPNRLSDEEMTVMRQHVVYTDRILLGLIPDDIRRIAARHHEKLDGGGYPLGLTGEELTTEERLLAVADILSALIGVRTYKKALPRERVAEILGGMAASRHLDSHIVSAALDNYETLSERLNAASRAVVETYEGINRDFDALSLEVERHSGREHIRETFSGVEPEAFTPGLYAS